MSLKSLLLLLIGGFLLLHLAFDLLQLLAHHTERLLRIMEWVSLHAVR